MKVFICWSGRRSQVVAEALRDWIPDVIQGVKPWMSEKDIHAGSRWPQKLAEGLRDTGFGIVCLTPENRNDVWPHFEAGALSKSVEHSFVCPYLLDLKPTDVVGPLSQFQAKKADRDGTFAILKSINTARGEEKIEDERLQRAFDMHWKSLEKCLKEVAPPSEPHEAKREQADMVEELLRLVRDLARSQEDTNSVLILLRKQMGDALAGSSITNPPNLPYATIRVPGRARHGPPFGGTEVVEPLHFDDEDEQQSGSGSESG